MSKIQINDVKLDGTELFKDSETFLNESKDSEMEQIFGGLRRLSPDLSRTIKTGYNPEWRVIRPTQPGQPILIEPIHPREPINPREPIQPREPINPMDWTALPKRVPFPNHPQTPVIL